MRIHRIGLDQDLAAGDEEEQQHEEDPSGPRRDAHASSETGDDAAQDAAFGGSGQTLPGETLAVCRSTAFG